MVTTIGNGGGVVATCGQCGTAFQKLSARFCSRCGARRDIPAAAAVTAAAAARKPKPKEAVVSMPPLASAGKESVSRPPADGAKGTLRPFDLEKLGEKRSSGGGSVAPPPLTEVSASALEFRDPSEATSITTPKRRASLATAAGGVLSSAVDASLTLSDQQRRREQRASSNYVKDGSLTGPPLASMADRDQLEHVLTSSSQEDAAMGGAAGNGVDRSHVPIPPPEQRPPSTFPLSVALVRRDGGRAAVTDGADFKGASVKTAPTAWPAEAQASTSNGGDTEEAIASLRPSAEEEAQYTAWVTLSPDDLTPEMLQTSNASELRQWRKGSLIGRGTYGSVYLGLLPDGSFHAVKCVELGNRKAAADHLGALELVSLSREVNMMHRLRHRNLCTFKGVYFDSESACVCMFMEYIGGGSLSALVKKFKPLPSSVVRSWTQQLLSGLHYLHSQHIIHRDIKGDNVLVDTTADPATKSQIKLVDFGAARRLTDAVSQSSTVIGTPYWMAPEVVDVSGDGSGYSYKADVWSVGCTVAEMLTGRPPWPCKTSAPAAIMMIASATGMPTEIPEEEATPGCLDFMRQCFIRDPEKRPTVQQLLQHPWIQVKME
ncbi:NPK1-related protein kinase-like [Leishmania donovani]|uniref:NPK1-related protein kinase-like n=1 Tax=Leishmania donovani TaxID=5661 RepID=A0A3Q8ICW9_LEIDO|nr:NPK1-related protein kinase-like [Leishmania donovani]